MRTVGRESFPRTIESIERQAWRPIEIVVVMACAHVPPSIETSVPVRIVGGQALDRPRAANAGLEAAAGEWLLFVDEDDRIEPDHVASLLATASATLLPVAYSQSRLVDADGNTKRFFGGPFRRDLLQRSNYLSFNAVIFHRRFVDVGLRFDESFPIFEDWDFWLQLAARCDFAFSGRPTAIYCGEGGQSGAGAGANLDRDAVLFQRARLMRKWGIAA